jgi:hypothetical protein
VKADDPEIWERLAVWPVNDVRMVPEHRLLVFADFTKLFAYGANQLIWKSAHICGDDLRILNVSGDRINGVGYSPADACDFPFAVDIRTGQSLNLAPVCHRQ